MFKDYEIFGSSQGEGQPTTPSPTRTGPAGSNNGTPSPTTAAPTTAAPTTAPKCKDGYFNVDGECMQKCTGSVWGLFESGCGEGEACVRANESNDDSSDDTMPMVCKTQRTITRGQICETTDVCDSAWTKCQEGEGGKKTCEFNWWLVLIILLVVICICGGGYFLWKKFSKRTRKINNTPVPTTPPQINNAGTVTPS